MLVLGKGGISIGGGCCCISLFLSIRGGFLFFPRKNPKFGAERRSRVRRRGLLEDKRKRCERGKRASFRGYFLQMGRRIGERAAKDRCGGGGRGECEGP